MNLKLKAKIIEKFGTQADFASVLKGDESFVSRVIHGRRYLSAEKQKAWANILDCEQNQIFEIGIENNV